MLSTVPKANCEMEKIMPFIDQVSRRQLDNYLRLPSSSGEKCYIFYKQIRAMWNKNPRWTTADEIYRWVQEPETYTDFKRAKELAWQVFFQKHVMKYEDEKEAENGGI